MTYDVFISCKSEDYESAKLIYNFLRDQNYKVFLADTELRKKGNAEYGKVIDEALDSAAHLILYTSRAEYATSSYVESEWRIFIEEKRAGRKHGNLISVLDGIEVSVLPISLRHFQSFPIERFMEIVDYLPPKAMSESLSEERVELLPITETIIPQLENEFNNRGYINLDQKDLKTLYSRNDVRYLIIQIPNGKIDIVPALNNLANSIRCKYPQFNDTILISIHLHNIEQVTMQDLQSISIIGEMFNNTKFALVEHFRQELFIVLC